MTEERQALLEEERRVKDLLNVEERASYYEIKSRLLLADLNRDLPEVEYDYLYKKASKILLTAVDREIEKRKEEKMAKYLSDEKTRIQGEKREITKRIMAHLPEMTDIELVEISGLTLEDIEELRRNL